VRPVHILKIIHLSAYDISLRRLVYTKLSEKLYLFTFREEGIHHKGCILFATFVTLEVPVSNVENLPIDP